MSTNGELACAYAVMILHDEGIPITAEKIATLLKVANVSSENYWPSLFAKLAQKRDINELILNASTGGTAAPVASGTATTATIGGAATTLEVEKKKEDEKVESDGEFDDGMFDLFADD